MKRTTLTASLVGSAAAGLIAAAIATPAWAQATTYPEGTDCSAIQNSTNRQDCMNQLNESRQQTTPGVTEGAPNSDIQPTNPDQPSAAPAGNAPPAGVDSSTGGSSPATGGSSGSTTGGSSAP
jgi:hypothetical protein